MQPRNYWLVFAVVSLMTLIFPNYIEVCFEDIFVISFAFDKFLESSEESPKGSFLLHSVTSKPIQPSKHYHFTNSLLLVVTIFHYLTVAVAELNYFETCGFLCYVTILITFCKLVFVRLPSGSI